MGDHLRHLINLHTGAYAVVAYAVWGLAVGLVVWRAWRWWGTDVAGSPALAGPSPRVLRGWLLVLLLAGLVLLRLPLLLTTHVFHVDEVEFLVAAQNLQYDPVPWRGADAHSSGPLNLYPLLIANMVGLPMNYATPHVVALLLVVVILYLTYVVLARRLGEVPALIATSVGGWLTAFSVGVDYGSYNSLYPSCVLLAVAGYALERATCGTARTTWWAYLGGAALGAVPYAKLQAVPPALVVAAIGLVVIWRSRQAGSATAPAWGRLAAWIGGGLSVPLLFTLVAVATGTWPDFVASYLQFALAFGAPDATPWRSLWHAMVARDCFSMLLHATLLILGLLLLAGPRALLAQGRALRWWWLGALAWLGAALYAIFAPQLVRAFYLALLLQPLMLLVALATAVALRRMAEAGHPCGRRRLLLAGGLVVSLVSWQSYLWSVSLEPAEEVPGARWWPPVAAAPRWLPYTPVATVAPSRVARFLAQHAQPGDRVAIWGWAPWDYCDSGLRPATREALINGPTTPVGTWFAGMSPTLVDYYQRRYLSDVQRSQPTFFVDATSSNAFFFRDRRLYGHETFPALAAYIAAHYTLVYAYGPQLPEDAARVYVANRRLESMVRD